MALGPPHALAPLLLEDANLRPAGLAVDHAEDLHVGDERGAGEHLAAVLLEEQHAIDADFVPRTRVDAIDDDHAAWLDPHLPAAALNDCEHLWRSLKGRGKTID